MENSIRKSASSRDRVVTCRGLWLDPAETGPPCVDGQSSEGCSIWDSGSISLPLVRRTGALGTEGRGQVPSHRRSRSNALGREWLALSPSPNKSQHCLPC